MNPRQTPKTNRKNPCIAALLLGLVTVLVSVPTQAESVSASYTSSTNSLSAVPGLKLTPSAFTDLASSPSLELTSFTWLTARSGGTNNPTGRGTLWIFDASKFDPTGITSNAFTTSTEGFVAQSLTYADGAYKFSSEVILDTSKSYYFLNSSVVSSAQGVSNYGGGPGTTVAGIERWSASNGGAAWAKPTDGVINFSATFTAIPEPTTVTALLGLAGIVLFLFKRLR